jgi:hypothetical protein
VSVSSQQLMAYIDGELPPAEAAIVEAALANDAALRAEYQRQKAVADSLQNAFAPLLDAPMPERLLQATRRRSVLTILHDRLMVHPFGMAGAIAGAAVGCGLLIGIFLVRQQGGDFVAEPQGVVARADLAHALDTQLASNQDHAARITVGISFLDGKDRYCRTFTAGNDAGIACHDHDAWRIKALAPANLPGTEGSYRMAAGEMPDAVRDAAAAMMRGPALSAAQEAQARAAGWKH